MDDGLAYCLHSRKGIEDKVIVGKSKQFPMSYGKKQ